MTPSTYASQVIAVVKPGCPACEQTKPAIAKAKKKVRFAEINVDEHPSAVEQYDVDAFPALLYKNSEGKVHHMPWKGVPTASSIIGWVEKVRKSIGTSLAHQPQTASRQQQCTQCGPDGVPPKQWGPPVWFVIHMTALMYPRHPTPKERLEMVDFFRGLQKVLPCSYCAKHFAKELSTMDPRVFNGRDSLFEWTVKFHNAVSDRTHNPQPRHDAAYWRHHYKKLVMKTLTARKKT